MPENPSQTAVIRPDIRQAYGLNGLRNTAYLIFVAGLLTLTALHKIALPSPVMAGDEYAYLAAVLDAIDDGHRKNADPMLQGVYLPMFTGFGALASHVTSAIVPVYKALNFIFFALASVLFAAIARPLVPARNLRGIFLLLCISPISAYTAYLMPESLYYVLFASVAAALVLVFPRHEKSGLVLAGISTAALTLTKPHAIVVFAATLATLAAFHLLYAKTWRAGLIKTAASCIFYVIITLIAMVGLNWVTSGTLILNPYHLIGEFYRPFLQSGLDPVNIGARVGIMLRNGLGHLLIVAAFALVPVTYAILGWLASARAAGTSTSWRSRLPAAREFLLVAFATLALAAMVVMTISFTAQVASLENGQALRLHGRYYSFALPLLFIILAMAHRAEAAMLGRAKRALLLIAFFCGTLVLQWKFTIFPWDFPELISLAKSNDTFTQIVQKTVFLVALGFLLIPRSISIRKFFHGAWITVFSASLLIMLHWQTTQTSAFSDEINAGKAAHSLLSLNEQVREVAVIGDDRYGRMAYFLFNLAAAPRVIAADKPGADLSTALTGAHWIFSLYRQNLDVNGVTAMGSLGQVRYYRQGHAAPYTLEKLGIWNGAPLHLQFGAGQDDGLVNGANKAEPWGLWTATETSTINLPALVSGKIRVTLDGWVTPERISDTLQIALGDAKASVHLSDRRAAFVVELQVDKPSRELLLSGIAPWQPNAWDRPLAVAIVRIDIENVAP